MSEDKQAQEMVEKGSQGNGGGDNPAAGPHAKNHLTDHEKTPGTGSLPDPASEDTDAGSE